MIRQAQVTLIGVKSAQLVSAIEPNKTPEQKEYVPVGFIERNLDNILVQTITEPSNNTISTRQLNPVVSLVREYSNCDRTAPSSILSIHRKRRSNTSYYILNQNHII